MARKPKPSSKKPSFFKVMTHDFTRQLKMPSSFVHKHGETLPKRCKLRTSSGETFEVRIEKTSDGKQCCFTGSGWSKFVNDLGLEIGESAIMWFDGKLEFDVSVFQNNGCEKDTFRCKPEPVELNEDENVSNKQVVVNEAKETEVGAEGDEPWLRFEIVMKEYQKFRVTIPKEFAMKSGLIDEKAAVLRYLPEKTHWAVLLVRRPGSKFQLDLTSGWSKFCEKNGMNYKNTYSFTFNPAENVIQVELVK